MRKQDEFNDPNSCLSRAGTYEPIFVIRAKDPLGSTVVRSWAQQAEKQELHEPEKIAEARMLADVMDNWRHSQ